MTKTKLKPWVKQVLIGIAIGLGLILIICINNYLDKSMEQHIEKVSQECAEQGYGIKAKYTKEGDKYYVCNK